MSANRQRGKGNVGARRRQGGLAVVYDMRRAPAAFLQVRDQGSNPLPLARTKGAEVIMTHPYRMTLPISSDLAELLAPRILARVEKTTDGCWLRYVNVNPATGYTSISRKVDGKTTYYYAHRVMYVFGHGPIPDGLTVDHICEVQACCNPDHLRALTIRENVLRSATNPYAINARKTACNEGHAYEDGERRRCRKCRSLRAAAAHQRRKAQGVPSDRPEIHGTRSGYQRWSCRCDQCCEWQRIDYSSRATGGAA